MDWTYYPLIDSFNITESRSYHNTWYNVLMKRNVYFLLTKGYESSVYSAQTSNL